MNKRNNKSDPIRLRDLDEGCLLVDQRNYVWLVEDIIENRIILTSPWGNIRHTRAINIGRKGYLYGFSLFE